MSGQSLDEFFRTRIFDPLGMTDTGFWAEGGVGAERLAGAYLANPDGPAVPGGAVRRVRVASPAGGVVGWGRAGRHGR